MDIDRIKIPKDITEEEVYSLFLKFVLKQDPNKKVYTFRWAENPIGHFSNITHPTISNIAVATIIRKYCKSLYKEEYESLYSVIDNERNYTYKQLQDFILKYELGIL